MVEVTIELSEIADWDSFHAVFARAMGFPASYGQNLNAWIDSMTDLSSAGTVGMTSVQVEPGDELVLRLLGAAAFAGRCPEIAAELLGSTGEVNARTLSKPGGRRILLLPA